MPYIIRDNEGNITGMSKHPVGHSEFIADDSPEFVDWQTNKPPRIDHTGMLRTAILSVKADYMAATTQTEKDTAFITLCDILSGNAGPAAVVGRKP